MRTNFYEVGHGKPKMKKPQFKTVGDEDWKWMRAKLLDMLEDAKTEKQYNEVMKTILISCGTKKEMIQRRKQMGIKPFTKEELKRMDE